MSNQDAPCADGAACLRMDGEISIYRAAELKPLLQDAMRAAVLEIDLSAVNDIDSAGIQLLIWAKKSAAAAGREVRLVRHSTAVIDVLEMMNLAAYFGDPLVIASAASSSQEKSL